MSKSATSAMLSALASENTYLCRIWRITLTNGTILRFTDLARSVSYGAATYAADPGIRVSAVTQAVDGASQNATLEIALGSSSIQEADIRAGRLDRATFKLSAIDWSAPDANGEIVLMQGVLSDIDFHDKGLASILIKGMLGSSNPSNVGNETYSKLCRAQLGDSRCTKDLTALTYSGVVNTINGANPNSFTSTAMVSIQTDSFFSGGVLSWLTGANAGTKSDIQNNVVSSGQVSLVLTPAYPISVGDTFSLQPGCDKKITTCKNKYNNLLNFRGEAYSPPPNLNPLTAYSGGYTDGVGSLVAKRS